MNWFEFPTQRKAMWGTSNQPPRSWKMHLRVCGLGCKLASHGATRHHCICTILQPNRHPCRRVLTKFEMPCKLRGGRGCGREWVNFELQTRLQCSNCVKCIFIRTRKRPTAFDRTGINRQYNCIFTDGRTQLQRHCVKS